MTPIDYYRDQCAKKIIMEDPEQLALLAQFQEVYEKLLAEYRHRRGIKSFLRKPRLVPGLYVWGGVGIGKTFLLDCFYHCLPFSQKMRMHFHSFMQMIHQKLKTYQGQKEPLQVIAKEIAQRTMVLCFDELHISDITDAMLLARLFKALFAHGVTLVITSNSKPDDLYKNGLQRSQFLPAIALLKQHTKVVHVPTTMDYRKLHLKQAGIFYLSQHADAIESMEKSFLLLANGHEINHEPIEIHGRKIEIKKRTDKIIWFDFHTICSVPRSQHDYLSIAKQFRTIFISDIPKIPPNAKNIILLFIRLIDVLYDARVRLIFSAEVNVADIYNSGSLLAEYGRTCSRLIEMQSEKYFLNIED